MFVIGQVANLIEGLLALYATIFEARWVVAARELADTMLERFADPTGGFFDTADDAEMMVITHKYTAGTSSGWVRQSLTDW